jgi:hypothetical protein
MKNPCKDIPLCPCCGRLAPTSSDAEMLADVAESMWRNKKIECAPALTDAELAVLALAVEYRRRGAGFVFRACCEGWEQTRIVREMY